MFVNALTKFRKAYSVVMEACCVLILAAIIIMNVFQVFSRYFLPNVNFSLAEELTITSFCWIFGMGIFPLWSQRANLRMDLISTYAPKRVIRILDIAADIFGILGGVIFIVVGVVTYRINMGFRSVYLYDESFRYVPFIFFGAGLFLAAVTNIILDFCTPVSDGNETSMEGGPL